MNVFIYIISILLHSAFGGEFSDSKIYQKKSQWYGFNPKIDKTQFILCRIDSNGAHNPEVSKEKVFFDEGSDEVKENEKEKIKSFLSKLPNILNSLSLTAHADQCGEEKENLELSKRRAEHVKAELEKLIDIRVDVTTTYFGEHNSYDHSAHDRFVEMTFTGKSLAPKIQNVYLIDGSGSFQNNRSLRGMSFDQIKRMSFDPETLVFVVREAKLGCQGSNLQNYRPEGGTFIKEAQALMALKLKGELNLITITDGQDPFTNDERQFLKRVFEDHQKTGTKINWYSI